MGDRNNDGYDDFMTWDYRRSAFICNGGPSQDIDIAFQIDSVSPRFDNIGDINGDNFDDFIIPGRSQFGYKTGLYYGGPDMDDERDAWFGWDSLYGIGYSAYGMDFNKNGIKEVVSFASSQRVVLAFDLIPFDTIPDIILRHGFEPLTSYYFGEGITSGDFNGDSETDLALNVRPRSQLEENGYVYLYFGGDDLDTIPNMIIQRRGEFESGFNDFGEVLENLGDVNGDTFDDLYAGTGNSIDSTAFVFFGGPDIDTIPDVIIAENSIKARAAGDVNNDGFNDIIISLPIQFSSLGYAFVYYGGEAMDANPDVMIYNTEFPGTQTYFGQDCSGVGDFNGDSIDDFAISAIDYATPGFVNQGVVYIFSGVDESTDVEFDYEPTLPGSFRLNQNYPNPFNSTTTISFDVPYKSHITLVIYNILGQEVTRLIDKQLTAGTYKVTWDGNDRDGDSVSTGIYLYKLECDQHTTTRKMMLLK